MAFTNDGKYIATASLDNITRIWNITTNREIISLIHENKAIPYNPLREISRFVSFSADGKLILTFCNMDDFVQIWDVSTRREIARVKHNGQINSAAFSPDGKCLATTGMDNTTRLWDISSDKEIMQVKLNRNGEHVIFSPDGKYIAGSIADNTVRVWNSKTGQEVARMVFNGPVIALSFSTDSKLLASASADRTARV